LNVIEVVINVYPLGKSREKSLLSLSLSLSLSLLKTRAMCDTIVTLASTGGYKDIGKDGNNLPLQNTCVTNDHGYVPFVVRTFWSFSNSLLITDFVTGATCLGITSGARTAYPSRALPILIFMCSIL
jgi:hypothetical protein